MFLCFYAFINLYYYYFMYPHKNAFIFLFKNTFMRLHI